MTAVALIALVAFLLACLRLFGVGDDRLTAGAVLLLAAVILVGSFNL